MQHLQVVLMSLWRTTRKSIQVDGPCDNMTISRRTITGFFCNVGKLGCSVCRDVVNVDDKINVSQEWSHYGPSRAAQQTSLRKKA